MKYCILIISLIFFFGKVSNGQNSAKFIFNEFQISLNRTTLQNDNTEDRYGFGLGVYHSFLSDKRINILFGFEYNRTSQFKKTMDEGHFQNATDLTYNLNYLSVPVGFRFNIGSETKLFLETGGYADFLINANRTGTMYTYLPYEDTETETEIDEKVKLSNSIGLSFGLGVRIPISKFELIVKPDYKFGINKLDSENILNRYFRINIGLKLN